MTVPQRYGKGAMRKSKAAQVETTWTVNEKGKCVNSDKHREREKQVSYAEMKCPSTLPLRSVIAPKNEYETHVSIWGVPW